MPAFGSALLSLGPALVANSLRPRQKKLVMSELGVQREIPVKKQISANCA